MILGYSWRSITRSSSPSYMLPWKLDDPGESSFSLQEIYKWVMSTPNHGFRRHLVTVFVLKSDGIYLFQNLNFTQFFESQCKNTGQKIVFVKFEGCSLATRQSVLFVCKLAWVDAVRRKKCKQKYVKLKIYWASSWVVQNSIFSKTYLPSHSHTSNVICGRFAYLARWR